MNNKRKKFRLKKKVKLFLVFIVILGIILVVKPIFSHKKTKEDTKESVNTKNNLIDRDSYLGTFQDNTGNLSEEDKNLIIDYTNLYYKSMIDLNTRDVKKLFDDENSPEAYLTYNALDLLIKHHKMQNSDMRLRKASYDIRVEDVTSENKNTIVKYREDDNISFNYLKDADSKGINIENTMVINNGKIVSLRVTKDNYVMFTNKLDTITKDGVDTLKAKYLKEMQDEKEENDKLMEEAFKTPYKAPKTCKISYDREKARDYSYKYLTERNPNYTAFDDLGGNCMNLVSQSMHEGGLPMDLEGKDVWKYFGPEQDETTNKRGRSASWTGTQTFYSYIKDNDTGGICADPDVNIFYADVGDVGQVGFDDSFNHSVLIVKVIKDKNGKTIDLLLNCNTTTFKDFPFLAYVYPQKRIIKILGSN